MRRIISLLFLIAAVCSLLALVCLPCAAAETGSPYLLALTFSDAAAGRECGAELTLRTLSRQSFGYGAVRFTLTVKEAPEGGILTVTYPDEDTDRDWVTDRIFPKSAALMVGEEADQHYFFTACFSHSGTYLLTVGLRDLTDDSTIASVTFPVTVGEESGAAEALVLPEAYSVTAGQAVLLPFSVLPNGAALPATLLWESSAPEVASISQDGLLTALTAGQTAVTLRGENGLEAVCLVTVEEETLPPETEPATAAPETDRATEAPETDRVTEAPETDRVTETPETDRVTETPETDPFTGAPETASPASEEDLMGSFARGLLFFALGLLGLVLIAFLLLVLRARRIRRKAKKRQK